MNPAVIAIPAVLVVGALAFRAHEKSKLVGPKSADPTAFKTPEQLAQMNAEEAKRVASFSAAELAVVDQMAVPGLHVAEFDLTDEGTLPLGTFKAGDIFPTDRVSIGVKAAKLEIPGVTSGSILMRATKFNTDDSVTGIVIAPPAAVAASGDVEQTFPLFTITGVATVDLTQTEGKAA